MLLFLTSGITPESDVEHQGRDNEEAENDDLENQTADNDVPAKLRVRGGVSHASLYPQSGTARLDDETENVSEHEDAGKPSRSDYGAMSGVDGADESAECHVQGCCEEDGPEQKQGRLQDIWQECARRVICQGSANVAYSLDCT